MSKISEYLNQILHARYGKDVRQSIHDAIHTCYEDGKAGAIDLVAREQIEEINERGVGVEITYEAYQALPEEEKANGDYYITDYPDEFAKAVNIPIDAISGLDANNVQNALAELKSAMTDFANTDLGSDADLNTFTKSGFYTYFQSQPHSAVSVASGSGSLIVVNSSSFIHQLALIGNFAIAIRRYSKSAGAWNDWQKFVTEDDLNKKTTLKYVDVTFPTSLTISAYGYLDISRYRPVAADKIVCVEVTYFGDVSPRGAFTINCRGGYLVSSANAVISNLTARYWYTE